ncbi:MAG: DNA-3-methyladenine glycosylase 2 family protein [Rhodospirillales bacterium]|nr:DNA-3-methyladenine glycosylase 2 family protein [Rhodospirillales bacterium]
MRTPAPDDATPRPDTSLGPALETLGRRDADLARAYAECGLPRVRRQPSGFAGLARIIVAQQLSTASAGAIIGRLESQVRPLTPQRLLRRNPATLAPVGLSHQKTRTLFALAADVIAGRIDLGAVATMDDERAIEHLIQASGIGPWTAHIYLLSALGRPDVWPADDLAVQRAVQALKGLNERPDRTRMIEIAEGWRPYRSAAARLLWHFYRHPGVPT